MYFWSKYPFVRLVAAFIGGILAYDYFPAWWSHSLQIIGCILFVLLVSVFFANNKGNFYRFRHLHGILALSAILLVGGCFNELKYHSWESDHYKNLASHPLAFSGTVQSYPADGTKYIRYDLEIQQYIFSRDSIVSGSGLIHLYIKKDSVPEQFEYGDHLIVKKRFFPISEPKNPDVFNYRLYLERQGIYSQGFVSKSEVLQVANKPSNPILALAFRLRAHAASRLQYYFPGSKEIGIAEALLLGIKDHIDEDLKQAYSTAGAMHVLAVSGLHVGIIYLIVRILFGKMKSLGKAGRLFFAVTSVLIIWFYALVTDMSPSVLRAATMFSIIAITEASTRESNIYNTLAFTAFILLLYDPYLIYAVGFQLSFIAVLGIVYLQPKLHQLFLINNRLIEKTWAISCVSLAAQIATLPLTLYYFHQFPTYFFLSNLIVIPAAFGFLVGGLLLLILDPVIPMVAGLLGQGLNYSLKLINYLIGKIETLPNPTLDWISLDLFTILALYLFLLALLTALHNGNFKTMTISAFLLLSVFADLLIRHEQQSRRNELVFYRLDENLVIDHVSGYNASLFTDSEIKAESSVLAYQIDPYRRSSFLRPSAETSKKQENWGFKQISSVRFGHIQDVTIFIFDSTTFHLDFLEPIEVDIIIIRNEAVKSLDWLKKHFVKSQYIIISTGNSFEFTTKMKEQAEHLNLNIHSTKWDGSLILDLNGIKKERTMLPALFTTNPD